MLFKIIFWGRSGHLIWNIASVWEKSSCKHFRNRSSLCSWLSFRFINTLCEARRNEAKRNDWKAKACINSDETFRFSIRPSSEVAGNSGGWTLGLGALLMVGGDWKQSLHVSWKSFGVSSPLSLSFDALSIEGDGLDNGVWFSSGEMVYLLTGGSAGGTMVWRASLSRSIFLKTSTLSNMLCESST